MRVTITTTTGVVWHLDGVHTIREYPMYLYFNGNLLHPRSWKKNGVRRSEIRTIELTIWQEVPHVIRNGK